MNRGQTARHRRKPQKLATALALALAAAALTVIAVQRGSAAPSTAPAARAPAPAPPSQQPAPPIMLPPTPLPDRLVQTRPMDEAYRELLHRSIFIKGSKVVYSNDEPRPETSQRYSAPPPESLLVFNGAARTNNVLMAFFEDTGTHQVLVLQDGQRLAKGKVEHITLDSIDYDVDGHVTHVALGQSLAGTEGPSLANLPAASLGGGSASSGDSGSGGDSILERLRRRRQQELGITPPPPANAGQH